MADGAHNSEKAGNGTVAKETMRSHISNIVSPPGSKTPPSMPTKRTMYFPDNSGNRQRAQEGAEPVDPSALAKALKDFENAGSRNERTPTASPCRKRQR